MAPEAQHLDIIFSHHNNVYKAGSFISGHVTLDLTHEVKIKGVRLHLHGVARVHWDETRAYTKGSARRLSHKHSDIYLDETRLLVSKTEVLKTGNHRWPFSIHLAINLPASYEGRWGRVQYSAKATAERAWKADLEYTMPFTILGVLDLNTEPDAKHSAQHEETISAGLACCPSGSLHGWLRLMQRGFTAGERMSFAARVNNKGRNKVNARVVFSQVAVFRADSKVRRSTTILHCMVHGDIAAGEDRMWEDSLQPVPILPPSRLGSGCKHIDMKYLLTLVVVPAGAGKDLEVPIEVLIATVPFHDRAPLSHEALLTSSGQLKDGHTDMRHSQHISK